MLDRILGRTRRTAGDGGPPEAEDAPTGPSLSSACYAPHSALYFEPNGVVQACCATGYDLGRVNGPGRETLRQIWDGANLAAQRHALEQGSYAYGCQECELAEAGGGRRAATAYHFDRYAEGAPHPYPLMMDFALSNRCNLQCVMCNGGLSSTIRAKREGLPPLPPGYDDVFFEELDEFLPHLVRAQFKGGEPFLARENRRIWDAFLARGLRPEISVTTNATLFNENVARYVRELRMHPILSIDGMQAHTLESIRVGVDAPVLWRNVDRFQAIAEETGAGLTMSFCLMVDNWREALPFLEEAERRGVSGNVIFVNQPHRFDLLRRPAAEVAAVHAELRAAPVSLQAPDLVVQWHQILDRLQTHLEHPVELRVAVDVPTPRRRSSVPAVDVAEVRAALEAERGAEALAFRLDDDNAVAGIDTPAWADWLDPAGWAGTRLSALEDRITETIGSVVAGPLPPDRAGIDRWSLQIAAVGGRRALDVHVIAMDGAPVWVLMFEVDPATTPTTR